jgi:lipid II:glycine glycyltransferase (peptidoglycan interpeptide bridge formation enzyme)
MYYNFDKAYKVVNEFFHYFCIPKGFIGFSFADGKQANSFYKKIVKNCIKKKIDPQKYRQAKSRQDVIIGKSKNAKAVKKITGFVHTGGFTLSLKDGEFDVKKLPPEYRRIMKKAGIRKKDLKN